MEAEHRYKRSDRSNEAGGMSSHDSPAKRSRGARRKEYLPLHPESHGYDGRNCVSSSIILTPIQAGYSRILLATVSLYCMPLHSRTYSPLYSASCLLDVRVGTAARYFEHTTQFGAVMDMVTDRCTTSCPAEWCSRQARSPNGALSFKD